MIVLLISLMIAFCIGCVMGLFLFAIFTIGVALNGWCTLPIANFSTLETFIEIYIILFLIFRKIRDNVGWKAARIVQIVFWTFAGITGFITILVAYKAFRYGIDSPRFVYTLVDGIPVLDWIENGIIQLWFKIQSFFDKIVQAVDNFVGDI